MCSESVKAQILSLPEVASWPQMTDAVERFLDCVKWDFPLLACQAVGGDVTTGIIGAAAIACMQLSLVLVDDMLDEDPRGAHRQLGLATTANLAFAFQAAAFRLIELAPGGMELCSGVYASLAQMALTSAFGQALDAQNLGDEENYWKVAQAKSAVCFGTALRIGALLGRAPLDVVRRLYELGFLVGEIIQIYDDLADALESPASPDWKQGRNNLAILYALTADHPERTRFEVLRTQVDDPQVLKAVQRILIRCGAVSYCAYHVVKRHQAAKRILDSVPLADRSLLLDLLGQQMEPVLALLESVGVEVPAEFWMV